MSENTQKINATFSPINTTDRPVIAEAKPKRTFRQRLHPKRLLLSIGFIVLVIIVGTVLFSMVASRSNSSPSNQVKSVFSGEEMREYNSPDNGFAIMMPGFPTITKTTTKSGDKEIPITTYERIVDNRSKNYTLAVYDYKGMTLDVDKALESALNSSLQSTPGAKILTTKKGVYNGNKAIEAAYTVTDKSKTYDAHIRYVIKDSRMYSMILIGSDQAKFDEFANSLRIN